MFSSQRWSHLGSRYNWSDDAIGHHANCICENFLKRRFAVTIMINCICVLKMLFVSY